MAIDITDPVQLEGAKATGRGGAELGTVEAVYFDESTERPRWAAVKTGILAKENALVPLVDAAFDGVVLTVPYEKAQLDRAPRRRAEGRLSRDEEAELAAHYGLATPENGAEEVAMGLDAVERDHVDRSDESRA